MAGELSVAIDELDVEAARDVLPDLKELLDGAYYDSHMYRDLTGDLADTPDPFRLFLATSDSQPIGVSVVEQKEHKDYDYLGYPSIHLKRFVVAGIAKGTGLSARLLDASKAYAFEELGLDVLFGESNEYAALARYGKEGAYYRISSVVDTIAPKRNNPAKAVVFFARDIDMTDPLQRDRRYVTSDGIHFAFPADEAAQQMLADHGYISFADVALSLSQD